MLSIKELNIPNYEKVIEAQDPDSGLHCFIAIHNTTLGPAMGGIRIYPYTSSNDALNDVLRLAKAMTYKSAMAENGLGGGKSVIIANSKTDKTENLLYSFGKVLNSLQGKYIAAEDVGSTTEDMIIIKRQSPFVAALPTEKSSGDPSRFTAWGVCRGLRAVAKTLWNNDCLRKKVIAIQGLGNVGSKLAHILFWEGAHLILCDKDPQLTRNQALLYGGQVIQPDEFIHVECDILVPCALDGSFSHQTVQQLQCKAIAGSANNQLTEESVGIELFKKKILYAPDYVINAGGIINAAEKFDPQGYRPAIARDKVNHIYDTLLHIFKISEKEQKPTNLVANELAERKLQQGTGKRSHQIRFEKSYVN